MSAMISVCKYSRSVVIALTLSVLAGCANKPTAPTYYTLKAETVSAGQQQLPANLSIGLWPVELPDLLDRSGIVTLEQQNRVYISSQNIWAGDLGENLSAVISKRLAARLGTDQLWSYPWESRQAPDLELRIRIEIMSGTLQGPVNLEARVTLRDNRDQNVVYSRPLTIQQPVVGVGYDGYVATLNGLLATLADQIAMDISTAVGR
ncbi:MAG: PqiC family protein [Motiliproteus sp.]|nr:PqiC family protein [Motiliproteus sp.]MCW9051587.1 PqiC family protein [Motiliproteus sp.]